jgi:hypothetical protein
MRAQCIQECWHSTKCIKYTPEGGQDGFYEDIDPLDPIAQYFAFPPGTVKYIKYLGNKQAKRDPVETTIRQGESLDPNFGETESEADILRKELTERGIKFHPKTGLEKLKALLDDAKDDKGKPEKVKE